MSNARNLADLLDSNGDVVSGALDNVPPSNDASALTTGTLPIARIADQSITHLKLPAGETWSVTSSTGTGTTWHRYAIGHGHFLWRLIMDSYHAGTYINMPTGNGLNVWTADYVVHAQCHRLRRWSWHSSEAFNGFTGFNYVNNGNSAEFTRFNHSLGGPDARFHAYMITKGQ